MTCRDRKVEEFAQELYKLLLSDKELECKDNADEEIECVGYKVSRELDNAGRCHVVAENKLHDDCGKIALFIDKVDNAYLNVLIKFR